MPKPRTLSTKHILANLPPEDQADPAALQTLTLASLEISTISPAAFSPFASLSRLDLSSNTLTSLTLPALPSLRFLNLSSNPLSSFDLSQAPNLTSLLASRTQLNPSDLDPLLSLKVLVIDRCELRGVLSLVNCQSLETLVVSNNSLSEIDISSLSRLKKLSASHNPSLAAAPNFASCAASIAEIRLANCPAMRSLQGLVGAQVQRLALLDLSSSALVTSFDVISPCATHHLLTLNLRETPLRKRFATMLDYAQACFAALPLVALSLQTLDFAPIPPASRPNPALAKDSKEHKRREALRKRNLISDKLDKPDPAARRNKPCPCGSGVKYKLCCEQSKSGVVLQQQQQHHHQQQQTPQKPLSPPRKRPKSQLPPSHPKPATTPAKRNDDGDKSKFNEDNDEDDDDDEPVFALIRPALPVVQIMRPVDEDEEDVNAIVAALKRTNDDDVFAGAGKW